MSRFLNTGLKRSLFNVWRKEVVPVTTEFQYIDKCYLNYLPRVIGPERLQWEKMSSQVHGMAAVFLELARANSLRSLARTLSDPCLRSPSCAQIMSIADFLHLPLPISLPFGPEPDHFPHSVQTMTRKPRSNHVTSVPKHGTSNIDTSPNSGSLSDFELLDDSDIDDFQDASPGPTSPANPIPPSSHNQKVVLNHRAQKSLGQWSEAEKWTGAVHLYELARKALGTHLKNSEVQWKSRPEGMIILPKYEPPTVVNSSLENHSWDPCQVELKVTPADLKIWRAASKLAGEIKIGNVKNDIFPGMADMDHAVIELYVQAHETEKHNVVLKFGDKSTTGLLSPADLAIPTSFHHLEFLLVGKNSDVHKSAKVLAPSPPVADDDGTWEHIEKGEAELSAGKRWRRYRGHREDAKRRSIEQRSNGW